MRAVRFMMDAKHLFGSKQLKKYQKQKFKITWKSIESCKNVFNKTIFLGA